MRLLILILLVYLVHRTLKKWLLSNFPSSLEEESDASHEEGNHSLMSVDDVMIKDPFCETYFPRRNGVHLQYEGRELYFCSTQCRDGFLSEQKKR